MALSGRVGNEESDGAADGEVILAEEAVNANGSSYMLYEVVSDGLRVEKRVKSIGRTSSVSPHFK